MHGTLRFILALIVALSHLGITCYGYNLGVVAVVIFYLLAGMVAYKLISQLYPNQPLLYYKDRIKRIFPLYLLALLFSYIIYLFGASSYFMSAKPDLLAYLSNITVIPLSYFMYTNIDKFTLLPPVWSLGVELQFYILAPFILLKPSRTIIFLLFSFIIYALAVIGNIHTDYFGYRLIAGVLFIFLLGALLQKATLNHKPSKQILLASYLLLLTLSLYVHHINYQAPYNHETLFALLFGVPLLYLLSKSKTLFTNFKSLDRYLGLLSYPFFLVHFPMLWLVELFSFTHKDIYLILSLTFILSASLLSVSSYITKKLLIIKVNHKSKT